MGIERRRSLFDVITVIFLLPLCRGHTLIDYTSLPDLVRHSIAVGVRDLKAVKQSEEYYYRTEGKKYSMNGHIWHHSLFMFSGDQNKIKDLNDKGFIVTRAAQELVKITKTPLKILKSDQRVVNLWRAAIAPKCNCPVPKCDPMSRYRTIDGSCNNLRHLTWGAAFKPQRRYLPSVYDDGINKPRMRSVTGHPLPSPRVVSNIVHSTGSIDRDSKRMSVLFMTYGQFIDHDFIGTPMTKGFNGSDIMCCTLERRLRDKRGACHSIMIPHDDERFTSSCMNFVRSTSTPNDLCDLDVRNQVNQHTSYIDASLIYGSTADKEKALRAGFGGFLKISHLGLMPPTDDNKCMKAHTDEYCFGAGDDRNSVVPSLAVMHTVFIREHNRIAKVLKHLNPFWSDEKLFQEGRKIVAAILQHITYNEYLPYVLSHVHMKGHDLYSTPRGHHTVYNPAVDATATNSFGVAAFRFGHSQIPNLQMQMNTKYKVVASVPIEQTFNRPSTLFEDNGQGCERTGFWQVNSVQSKQDRLLQDGVRNNLFLDRNGNGFDLAALNIQRGREHGVPSYNAWRKWCGLPPAHHFGCSQGGLIHHDKTSANLLSQTYSHPDDIDLFTGGLSEINNRGTMTGPTFACIIARQFRDFKTGDRFWYENNFPEIGFNEAQLNEIKKVKMSVIMCSNMKIRQIQLKAFEIPSTKNPRLPCDILPSLDLRHWEETPIADLRHSGNIPLRDGQFLHAPYNPVPFWSAAVHPHHMSFTDIYQKDKK